MVGWEEEENRGEVRISVIGNKDLGLTTRSIGIDELNATIVHEFLAANFNLKASIMKSKWSVSQLL